MAANSQPVSYDSQRSKPSKGINAVQIMLLVVTPLIITFIAFASFFALRRMKQMDNSMVELKFEQFVASYNATTDFVEPTVNEIQFMRHGYSITFDHVDYTQNGLVLSGDVGNPTQIWISSLALNFSARPYPYEIEAKWKKSYGFPLPDEFFPFWSDEWTLGTAQTTVGALNPGSTTSFQVTIPNVKQTSNQIQIAVWFSGERYQYLGAVR